MVAVWELAARTVLAGRHLIGVPSGIVVKLVENAEVYGRGLWFTTREAGIGYLLGNLAAVLLALLVVLLPGLERMVLRLALVVYCLPLVALGPLLRLVYGFGDGPQITLAALAVYYLTLVPLLVGLRAVPRSWLDLTATYGRGRWTTLVTVRARAALPYLTAGLQASVPAAFLGALVGEFTGAERGVGVLSILALRSLDTDGLWALMLLSTAASLVGYWIVSVVARRLAPDQPTVLLSPPRVRPATSGVGTVGAGPGRGAVDSSARRRRLDRVVRVARAQPLLRQAPVGRVGVAGFVPGRAGAPRSSWPRRWPRLRWWPSPGTSPDCCWG